MAANDSKYTLHVENNFGGGWLRELVGIPHHSPVIVLTHIRADAKEFDSVYAMRDTMKLLRRLGYKVTKKTVSRRCMYNEHKVQP